MKKLLLIKLLLLFFICFSSTEVYSQYDEGGDDSFWEDYDNGEQLDEYTGYPDDSNDGNEDDDADNDDDWEDDWDDDDPWEDVFDGDWDDDYDNDDDDDGSSGGDSTSGGNNSDGNNDNVDEPSNQPLNNQAAIALENGFPDQLYIPAAIVREIPIKVTTTTATIAPIELIIVGKMSVTELAAAVAAYNATNPISPVQTSTVATQNLANYQSGTSVSQIVNEFNFWLQGYIIDNIDLDDEDLYGVDEVKFEECASGDEDEDECKCTTAIECTDCPDITCEENEKLDEDKCECIPSNCEYKTGYLHESAFENKTATVGENTVETTDNFRDESGAIIDDTNCGTGKIEADSEVNVTGPKEERDYIKSDGTTSQSNYYPIEYLDCPKGNRPGNPDYDSTKPCSDCTSGDPVPEPEIQAQLTACGVKGGMYGYTRGVASGCTSQKHGGVDIVNDEGDAVYAMFDGTASLQAQSNGTQGAGFYVIITSTVGDDTIKTYYFHLEEDNRVSGNVKAGDIIGYQGTSGNLLNGINEGTTESHVHIKVKKNGTTVDPIDYFKTEFNETTGEVTSSGCN